MEAIGFVDLDVPETFVDFGVRLENVDDRFVLRESRRTSDGHTALSFRWVTETETWDFTTLFTCSLQQMHHGKNLNTCLHGMTSRRDYWPIDQDLLRYSYGTLWYPEGRGERRELNFRPKKFSTRNTDTYTLHWPMHSSRICSPFANHSRLSRVLTSHLSSTFAFPGL